jgi:hypothetical protein
MSNHLHIVVHMSPEASSKWSAEEIAERWVKLYPAHTPEPCAQKSAAIVENPKAIVEYRYDYQARFRLFSKETNDFWATELVSAFESKKRMSRAVPFRADIARAKIAHLLGYIVAHRAGQALQAIVAKRFIGGGAGAILGRRFCCQIDPTQLQASSNFYGMPQAAKLPR